MTRTTTTILVCTCLLAVPATLAAQEGAGADADIEGGVTEAGDVEMGMDSGSSNSGGGLSMRDRGTSRAPTSRASGGIRLGLQARLDAMNVLDVADDSIGGVDVDSRSLFVPIVTPGVRLLEDRLFLGLGLGFQGASVEQGNGDETSRSGLSLSPLVAYDVLGDDAAALSLLGWLNYAALGETEECDPDCSTQNNDATGIGLNFAAGVRGKLSPGLAIGAEFGWGFMSISQDSGDDIFVHGILGTILFEATIGI